MMIVVSKVRICSGSNNMQTVWHQCYSILAVSHKCEDERNSSQSIKIRGCSMIEIIPSTLLLLNSLGCADHFHEGLTSPCK